MRWQPGREGALACGMPAREWKGVSLAKSLSQGAQAACEPHPRVRSLAAEALDHANYLQLTLHAYLALEKLITPMNQAEADDELAPSRAELGALLKAVNDQLQTQVHQLADTATVLQALVSHNLTVAP